MTDNNEKKKTLKEAYYEELSKRFDENPPEIPTYEDFSNMIDTHLAKKRRRKMRRIGIAASLTIAVLAGLLAFGCLVPDVGADKNPKEEIITEDGVIIEDGGWGSSEWEDNVWMTEDWDEVEDARVVVPNLIIPKYVPEGYKFKSLTIEKVETSTTTCEYIFRNTTEELEIEILIMDMDSMSSSINGDIKEIQSTKGTVYLQKEKEYATIQMYDGIIVNIWSVLNDLEIVEIIEKLDG